MSAYYDLYETPSPDGKEDKKSLHARICPKRTYTQKEFVEHIATFQHLPKNVIGAALDACIDEFSLPTETSWSWENSDSSALH